MLSPADENTTTSVQLIDTIDVPQAIEEMSAPFMLPYLKQIGLFSRLRDQLTQNQLEASKNNPKKLISAHEYGGTPSETVHAYLKDTPLEEIFNVRIPFTIPNSVRFEHTHILGGSGHGKTTLLCHQFLEDVESGASLIVIDGKGTLVNELQRFKRFEGSDRLIILNPQDSLFPPALNMFATPIRPSLPDEVKRQIENSAISNFEYIFGARDFKLTAKQATCLSYCVRLLFSLKPTPTIHTLLDLMAEPVDRSGGIPTGSRFKPFIEQQPPIVRRFFTDLFYHPTEYGETKRQIQNRIFDLLENPAFSAMFSTTECKLDLFDIIQNRKILLVNSSPSALGEKAAPLLGRYIIALALSSAYARLSIPKSEWTPTYIVIDEAQMFVDEEKTQPLLQQAREFNLGVVLAHQKLADLTPTLSATFAANTSIRYAGGVSASDAAFMAKNMHCKSDFIMAQRKTGATTSFATYVRGYTDRAVSLSVALGILDDEPKMDAAAYNALIVQNRNRVASSTVAAKPIPPTRSEAAAIVPTSDTHADQGDAGEPASKW